VRVVPVTYKHGLEGDEGAFYLVPVTADRGRVGTVSVPPKLNKYGVEN
jgi:hypothetical protein